MKTKKKSVIVDPSKNPLVAQAYNDIITNGIFTYYYEDKKKMLKWKHTSSIIGRQVKKINSNLEKPLIYPPTTSRPNNLGIIATPPDIIRTKEPFGKKLKFIFTYKIF